jgi:phage terminase small subunit
LAGDRECHGAFSHGNFYEIRIMSTTKTTTVPAHLLPESAAFYGRVRHDYGIVDPAGLALLTSSCEMLDRASQAREDIAANGLTFVDRLGNTRPQPAVAIERNALIAFSRIVKVLGLDVAPPPPSARRNGR